MNLKHYWINLDKCADRREYMEAQFHKKEIDNYRISAETPDTIRDNKYTIKRNEESINTTTPCEIACILSHLKAIARGYADGDPYFCVLEDDIEFINLDFKKMLKYVEEAENKNNEVVEILQLYTSSHPVVIQLYNGHFLKDDGGGSSGSDSSGSGSISGSSIIAKRHEAYPGAVYYMVSREGARKILDKYVSSEGGDGYDLSYYSWTAADNIIYAAVNSFVITYPVAITDITLGSTLHPEHLPNHEFCNNVIRHIWTVNNQLKMFSK
jgi:GR25 family glycosyltransferase involved in LPS biosynthesis